jgi:hypothetical protein
MGLLLGLVINRGSERAVEIGNVLTVEYPPRIKIV